MAAVVDLTQAQLFAGVEQFLLNFSTPYPETQTIKVSLPTAGIFVSTRLCLWGDEERTSRSGKQNRLMRLIIANTLKRFGK